jgi:hypothetical protein
MNHVEQINRKQVIFAVFEKTEINLFIPSNEDEYNDNQGAVSIQKREIVIPKRIFLSFDERLAL